METAGQEDLFSAPLGASGSQRVQVEAQPRSGQARRLPCGTWEARVKSQPEETVMAGKVVDLGQGHCLAQCRLRVQVAQMP